MQHFYEKYKHLLCKTYNLNSLQGFTVPEILKEFLEILNEFNKVNSASLIFLEWLKEKGLTTKIEEMISEMEKNGYFEQLVNIAKMTALEKKIDSKIISIDNTSNLYLGAFFDRDYKLGNDKFSEENYTYFHLSKDLKTWKRLGLDSHIYGRDSSVLLRNGKVYVARTKHINWNTSEFDICVSENLVDWKEYPISTGVVAALGYNTSWAPEWFEDNGKLYVLFSQEYKPNFTDNDGKTRVSMETWIVECTDLENLIFVNPRRLGLANDGKTRIDTTIVKKGAEYFAYTKLDSSYLGGRFGAIEIWKSTDLINWNLENGDLFNGYFFEGQTVVYNTHKKEYWMYLDNSTTWQLVPDTINIMQLSKNNTGNMYYSSSTDLMNWSEPQKIIDIHGLRHGGILEVTDIKIKKMLTNAYFEESLSSSSNNYEYSKAHISLDCSLLKLAKNGKYLKLFGIQLGSEQKLIGKRVAIETRITDLYNNEFDFNLKLDCEYVPQHNETVVINELFPFIDNYKVNNPVDLEQLVVLIQDNNELVVCLDATLLDENKSYRAGIQHTTNLCYQEFIVNRFNEFSDYDLSKNFYKNGVYGRVGTGTIVSNCIKNDSSFECNYITIGNLCTVNFVITLDKTIPNDREVLINGLPKAVMNTFISANSFQHDSSDTGYKTKDFMLEMSTSGELREWYGDKGNVDDVVKGSVTYICK